MSKRALIYILRYLLAIGLFAVYYAVFENQSHDLIQTVFAVAIGVGIATLPVIKIKIKSNSSIVKSSATLRSCLVSFKK